MNRESGQDSVSVDRARIALGNPSIESFHGRVRDVLLNIEDFLHLIDAEVVGENWRIEYNSHRPHRPHRPLDGLTSNQYRSQRDQAKQPVHL
jgi:putative transposase